MSVITLPLRGGPNETVAEHDLEPGELASVSNVAYDQDGNYSPRLGYTQLGGTELTRLRKLAYSNNELIAITGWWTSTNGVRFWTYDPGDNEFIMRGRAQDVAVARRPLVNTTSRFKHSDHSYCGDYLVVAWIESDERPRAAVYNKTTGAVVVPPQLLTATNNNSKVVKVVCSSSEAVVAWFENGTPTVKAARIALPGGTWGAANTIDTAVTGATLAVGKVTGDTANLYLCYVTSLSAVRVRKLAFATLANVATNTLTGSIAGSPQAIACSSRGNGELVVMLGTTGAGPAQGVYLWWTSSALTTDAFNDTMSFPSGTSWGTVAVEIYANGSTGGVAVATQYMADDTAEDSQRTSYQSFNFAGPVGSLRTVYHASIASDPVVVNGRCLIALRNSNLYQSHPTYVNQGSYHLVDLELDDTSTTGLVPRYVATIAPRQANQVFPLVGVPGLSFRSETEISSGVPRTWTVALPVTRAVGGREGLDLVTVSQLSAYQWPIANLGSSLYVGSHYYDGNRLVESGFAWWPTIRDVVEITGSIAAGTYSYRVTYARVNNLGELEESAPSDPVSITTGSSKNHRLRVRVLSLSSKTQAAASTTSQTTPVYVFVYRTRAASSGDTLYYRVNKEPVDATYAMDPSTQYLSIDVQTVDADLVDGTHPVLYTDSGELRHVIPESFLATCVHKNRVWGIAADGHTVWFSQESSDGIVPPFADLQSFSLDDPGDTLVGLASLYDKLLLFTTSAVYVVFGDGPSIAGSGSDLTSPQRITAPGGCVDPRSILKCPMGVAYRSSRGIELVGPDLSVTFLGAAIQRSLSSYPYTTSAVHCPNTSTLRWSVVDSEINGMSTGVGRLFVYDYVRQRWSIYPLIIGGDRADATSFGAPVLAATYHPTYGYVAGHSDSAAYVYRERTTSDSNPWLEFNSSFVQWSFKTGWFKSAGDMGWQRLTKLALQGTYYAPHTVTMNVFYDYSTTSADSGVWDTSTSGVVNASNREFLTKRPSAGKGRSSAVQFLVSVTKSSSNVLGNGRSLSLQSVALDVTPKPKINPVLATAARK